MLIKCKDCGSRISSSALRCRHCGAKYPAASFSAQVGLILLFLVLIATSRCGSHHGKAHTEQAAQEPTQATQTTP